MFTPDFTSLPPGTSAVETDLYCARCGYNLRTLAADGICPECTCPVRESVLNRYGTDLKWLRDIHRGLTVLFLTGLLSILVTVFFRIVVPLLVIPSLMGHVLRVGTLIVLVCSAIGVFFVTRRPVYVRYGNLRLMGRVVRVLIACTPAALLLPFVLGQALLNNQTVFLVQSLVMLLGCSWQVALFSYLYLLLSRFNVGPRFWCILAVSLAVGALAVGMAYTYYIYFYLMAGGISAFASPVFRLLAALSLLTHAGMVLGSTIYYFVCRSRVTSLIGQHPANTSATAIPRGAEEEPRVC